MVEAMHTTMGNLCSSLITDEGCTEVWHETGVGINMLALPRGFVQKVLVEQAGSELLNQIGEVRLDISLKLTNQAVDRMLELLSQMQRQLGKQLEKQGQIMAATPEEDFASDGLSKALPSFRRSQTRSRKMRPLSVDFEVDAGTEKVSAKGKTGSNRQAKDFGVGESVDPLVLPSEEDRQLEHITRSRPARPGRPGRPQHKTPVQCIMVI
uniref:CARMIL C-terminal domain-containing protein n=1 Tax=Eptatretus burgeri TaxID=7764 RepID=A0A8C4R028_EPTBU